jgi:ubiquinol-cytochrome c reductase cytochrome c1 subunit
MRKILIRTACAVALGLAAAPAIAAGGSAKIPSQPWSFDGVFGTFDRPSLRRGLVVYRQVCASCHGLRLVAFRHLADVGFSEDEVKEIAAAVEVQDGPNDEGEMFMRPGRAADHFPSPFANEKAARAANNGAFPPDLSLIIKARKNGANYLHALLSGYGEPPQGVTVTDGMYYNAYFPGGQIAMPQPLTDGQVDYADATEASVTQMAHDVTTFLAWVAEPELEARKRMGIKVILFLIVFTGMLYALKRQIWSQLH